ncbi:7031_t:CDS:2, partial [Cetraspora pellucida]
GPEMKEASENLGLNVEFIPETNQYKVSTPRKIIEEILDNIPLTVQELDIKVLFKPGNANPDITIYDNNNDILLSTNFDPDENPTTTKPDTEALKEIPNKFEIKEINEIDFTISLTKIPFIENVFELKFFLKTGEEILNP